ncbi:hypothetical protein GYMLUDRAFT_248235 [Collybiopsis luxurians FD-317 M1]|uniref:Unplaced genomic scaffold GYMLUscaffold_53, whole genome shotgun sequence n=1 Tax=Collybiopsis luxurians FD-317 M1 TaxID=944289 RepID=A0A0D0CDC0_9AGAR|nr:hypothetical protein GYMLUDRAFT_248235 [Collybiopsis luxurians FD-317 M1]
MSLPTQKISKAYTAFLSKLESSAFSPLKIRGIIERVVENKCGHLEGFKEIGTTSIAALAVILLIGIILIPARQFAKREASLNRQEKVLTQSMWAVDLDSEILAHERLTHAHLQQANAMLWDLAYLLTMNTSYTLWTTVDSPYESVNALAFSSDGKYLASVGDDQLVRVFGIMRKCTLVWQHRELSKLTAVQWRTQDLFIGSLEGELVAYSPIGSSKRSGEVAIIARTGSWYYQDQIPRPSFGYTDNDDKPELIATGAYYIDNEGGSNMDRSYNLNTRSRVQAWGPAEKIGFFTISPDHTGITSTNICSGLDWLKITTGKFKKISTTFKVQSRESNIPLLVIFINKGRAVLMATAKGYAIIFDTKEGQRQQVLKHGNNHTWITALAYMHMVGNSQIIATGDGNCAKRTQIHLWIQHASGRNPTETAAGSMVWTHAAAQLATISICLVRNILTLAGAVLVVSAFVEYHYPDSVDHLAMPSSIRLYLIYGGNNRPSVSKPDSVVMHMPHQLPNDDLHHGTIQIDATSASPSSSQSATCSEGIMAVLGRLF